MNIPVVFQLPEWRDAFPELAAVPDMRCNMAFAAACIRIDNSLDPDLIDDGQRKTVLYLLTAHIALLMAQAATSAQATDAMGNPVPGSTGTVSPGMTGRIASATEGSVSVSSEAITKEGASSLENWLSTTQYGALVWQLIEPLFCPFYIPGPDRSGYLIP